MEFGKPGRRMRKFCHAQVTQRLTKRGPRFVVTHPDTKMVRFISQTDYQKAIAAPDVCAYLPEPFKKGQ